MSSSFLRAIAMRKNFVDREAPTLRPQGSRKIEDECSADSVALSLSRTRSFFSSCSGGIDAAHTQREVEAPAVPLLNVFRTQYSGFSPLTGIEVGTPGVPAYVISSTVGS